MPTAGTRKVAAVLAVAALGLAACAEQDPTIGDEAGDRGEEVDGAPGDVAADGELAALDEPIEILRTATCGCCEVYEDLLAEQQVAFDVEVLEIDQLQARKLELGVPTGAASCHTSLVDGYVVEGHVPFAVIDWLLAERPDVDGVTLPGMPSGSPGMPGVQTEPWEILALVDGEAGEPVVVYDHGELHEV